MFSMGSSAFSRKKVFFQKKSTVLRTSQCVAETEIMRKKMERKNCPFKVEMKIWATAKRQKRASSGDEAPLSNWKLTSVDQWSHIRSDFDLITQLSSDHTSDFDLITHPSLPQKRTPHSERTILWSCQSILYSRSSSKSTEEEIGF